MQSLLILLLDGILLLISIAIIPLTAIVLGSETFQGTSAEPVYKGTSVSDFWTVWTIAPGVSYAGLKATLAAGCIGTAAGLLMLVSLPCTGTPAARSYSCMAASAAATITTIIAFVWSFVETYTSDSAYHGPFTQTFQRPVGTHGSYSVESWNCQTVSIRLPTQRGDSERWCALAVSRFREQGCCIDTC